MKKAMIFLGILFSSVALILAVPAPCFDEELSQNSNYGIEGLVESVTCWETFEDQPCLNGPTNILQKCFAEIEITKVMKGDHNVGDKINITFDKMLYSNDTQCTPGSFTESFIDGHKIKYYDATGGCRWTRLTDLEISDDENESDNEVLGASCITVTPGTQNECCQNKGYQGWNSEKGECDEEMETEQNENILGSANQHKKGNLTKEQVKNITVFKNRIKSYYANQSECPYNCTCSGSTVKCKIANGTREMTINAGNSGNVIIQVKEVNASTNVTLYKSDGKVYGIFNNETREIILPDEIKEKIQNRTKAHFENESYRLMEDGNYKVEAKKRAKLLWAIPVKEKVQVKVDAETGEIIRTKTSWWGFLARDVEAEETETQ